MGDINESTYSRNVDLQLDVSGPVNKWQVAMKQADEYAQQGQWEHTLKVLDTALHICNSELTSPTDSRYRYEVLDWLGFANRCLGRFDQAKDLLELALAEIGSNQQRVGICAELGVVYRHLDRLEDAKRVFQDQYETAKQFELDQAACRAVGNLGIVNYQLYMSNEDVSLLDLAINQLEERVQRARTLRQKASLARESSKLEYANALEAVGLSRLSLCYSARGETKEAVSTALEALNITRSVRDRSVVAISRFFYGRALSSNGQQDLALEQFNLNTDCTCAIAFSKEPSSENRQYLQELANIKADFSLADEQGYTALDYVVFNNDQAAEKIVLESLSNQFRGVIGGEVESLLRESRLRKGYREIFQQKMRPILLGSNDRKLHEVRQVYAETLATDSEKSALFDGLKYVYYRHFATLGRFPRSSDSITQDFATSSGEPTIGFIIFFSYRWINSNPWAKTPDDVENTQYLRTIAAVENFLKLHPEIDVQSLGVWIDVACIDQEAPMSGIAALPMVLAQCDALISLVDASYYDRAWCSMEVMMVQALSKTYGLHHWFEHVYEHGNEPDQDGGSWMIRRGSIEIDVDPTGKRLRFEEDRSKIQFLERQCKLLC